MHKRYGLLILIVIGTLLAACAPAPAAPVAAPEAAPAAPEGATAAPEAVSAPAAAGGESVLRVPLSGDPKSLEPGLALELLTSAIAAQMHAGLLRYDANMQLSPYLAESWESSEDGLSFTFHLNPNAKWHNGRQVVAADIKQGWERYLDPEVAAQSGGEYLIGIAGAQEILDGQTKELSGVEVVDDQTLRVTLTGPDPMFLPKLAVDATWTVAPEAVVEGKPEWVDPANPVGAGPFKFVEWRTNDRIILEANEDFFLGRPSLDRIEYYIVPDTATAIAQYEAGELDMVQVSGPNLQRAAADPVLSGELNRWGRSQLVFFGLNMGRVEEFRDPKVRQAFNYAFDREGIINTVLFGAYVPASGLVPPGVSEHNPELEGYEYNPERARELLAEAGFPGGQGFPTLRVTGVGGDSTLLEAFVAQINENLGLNLEVNIVERGEMLDGMWGHEAWDAFYWGWTATIPTAEVWVKELLYTGLDSNFVGYSNPELDSLVDQARVTVDEPERIALWQQAEQIAVEDAAMVPLGYSTYVFLVKPYVSGVAYRTNGPDWFKDVVISK